MKHLVQQIKIHCCALLKYVVPQFKKTPDRTLKQFVTIRILDLPTIGLGCNPVTCGLNSVTVKMMADALKAALEEAYPGKTATEYVNLMWTPQEQTSEFGKLLMNKKKPSPLVIIDNGITYAGSMPVHDIIKDIGAMLE
jgi:disulfide oxidoreductase YuzD